MMKMRNGGTSTRGVEGSWLSRHAAMLPAVLLALSGCSEDPGETTPLGSSYYALSAVTFGADNAVEGSIKFAPSLDKDASINEELTLESTGTVPLYPAESSDKLLNVLGKSGQIVKYALGEDGSFQQEGETIGFSAYGVSSFRAPIVPIVSETQAYLWDDLTFTTLRWNPSTMEITGEIEGVAPLFEGKNIGPDGTSYWTFRARYPIQVGTKVYETISYLDEATLQIELPYSGVFIIDTETDEVSYVEHPTCAGLENFMLAPDGYLYMASNGYAASNYIAGIPGINPPCLVRFDPKTDTFDDSFQVDFTAGADGKVVAGLVQRSGSSAYVKVWNESLFPADKSLSSTKDVNRAFAWEMYLIEDVANPTSMVLVDIPASSALLYPFEVDGKMHAASVDWSVLRSTLFDLSTTPPTPGIEVEGITTFALHLER